MSGELLSYLTEFLLLSSSVDKNYNFTIHIYTNW